MGFNNGIGNPKISKFLSEPSVDTNTSSHLACCFVSVWFCALLVWGIGSDFKFLLAGFRDCIGAFGFGFGGWGLRVHFFWI